MQPGGCLIGVRPVDTHFEALAELGLDTKTENGFYHFRYNPKKAKKEVVLKEFSVTATENVLMLASTLPQTTILKIAAIEPHVLDLVSFLNKMGAKIKHLPNHSFEIKGISNLKGVKKHEIIPDPIEAGSFIILGIACKGNLKVNNVRLDHLEIVIKKLQEFNAKFNFTLQDKAKQLYSVEIIPTDIKSASKVQTLPYPGIPTDLQSIFGVLSTQANGTTIIQDPMYEGRLKYVDELIKMGANAIIADPHRALIVGPTPLYGQEITSFDLRAGMCLIIAALLAKGESKINNIYQVDRGYEKIDERLKRINADIIRVDN
jgi:UDP-N-acetylglucosamine 1-carboxyvinyltransferase